MDNDGAATPTYDFSHECGYTAFEDEDERDDKYREEMLKVFGMEVFEESVMVERIESLCQKVSGDERLDTLCAKSANRYCLEELSIGMILMFNSDSFHLMHRCLQDFDESGQVSDEHYNAALAYLEN